MTLARLEAPPRHIKLLRGLGIAFVSFLCALVGLGLVIYLAEAAQEVMADAAMTADVARMPTVDVALVLGTSRLMGRGRLNPTYEHRLDSAAALWKAGKAKYLIVSGNGTASRDNDEASDMRLDLVRRGVPAEAIYRDRRGYRTWDSIVRARDVFGLKRFAVVSQRAHVARALFIARSLGLEAYGLEALEDSRVGWPTEVRIYPAALLAYYDAWRAVPPPWPGRPIAIGVDPLN
jgi:SanA protein